MRILHISSAKTFGGGERHLVDLCRGLAARGHDIFVALRPTCQWKDRLDFLPPENILEASIRNAFGVFSAQKIARFVSEKNIELIHAHVARDYVPASLVARMAGRAKFVLTRHVLFPMKSFHRFALSNVCRAIAVSAPVEESLRNIFPPEKIVVIPNGIELESWSPAEREKMRQDFRLLHRIPPDAFLVGTVGELKELKGQREFVLAANEVAKKFDHVRFVVVGKDNTVSQHYRRELKRLVGVFGLEDQFLFLDWVEELPPLLAALDVFVSASHSESFGLALLEAMASGAAVASTATEGAKQLLEHEVSGLLVPIKEPVALAQAIEDLIRNGTKRQAMAHRAQIAAQAKFSLDKMIEETERLYQSL